MLTVCNGFDISSYVPHDSIQIQQTSGDPAAHAQFEVDDQGSLPSFAIGEEVIIWNEAAPPEPNANPNVVIPATPAHNLVPLPNASPPWSLNASPLSSLFSGFPGLTPSMTFNNTTYSGGNNYGLATAQTPV